MEASSTYPKISFLRFFLSLLVICSIVSTGWGQTKEYATWAPSGGRVPPPGLDLLPGAAGVKDMPNAAISNDDNYAVMTADRAVGIGGLIIVAGGDAYLQLKFPTNRAPGATTYVRVDAPQQSGLPLNLGQLLGLVGSSVTAEVYSGAGDNSSSTGTLVNVNVETRLIKDRNGNYFLAITPEAGTVYNSVRIDLKYPDGVADVAGRITLNVYNAFTFDDITCGIANYASVGETTGINVALTDVVQNPELAIDADPNTHSTITTGALSLVGSIFQSFYFNGLSAPQDYFEIKFSIGGGSLLDLNLLGNFEVRAYNGNQLVYTKKLQGALVNGLDLLTLLTSGDPITVPFAPGVAFDRVAIGINTTAALSLASSPLEVYHVERYGLGDSPLTCVDPTPPLMDDGGEHMLGNNLACANVLVDHAYANFPFNAIDGQSGTYAVLEATSGSLLGAGAYSGSIRLGHGQILDPGTTSYIKIDVNEDGLLSGLLDGSLGEILTDVTDRLLFGDLYFTVDVYGDNNQSSSPIFSGSSETGFDDLPIRVIQDKYGQFYVAVTPDQAYQSVGITLHYPALIGGESSRTMKVYGLCYSTGSEECEQAFSTYFETSGISLDLLGVGDAGVTNAHLAIDDDDPSVEGDETYSEIGIGTAGVGASTFQFVDFHTLSSPADYFKVKIGVENGSVLDVELLNNIEIRAYNGDELVYSQRLQNGLVAGLDILGLLTTENVVTIPIGPGVEFDRVAVGVSTLLDVNALSTPVRLYSIKRFGADCPDPNPLPNNPDTESPFNGPDCGVNLGEFEHVNFAYNAIDGDIDTYATLSAGSGVVLGAGAYDGFIELGYDQPVPALETSYIRIDLADEGLLNALLGGSLGDLLADVGDLVLFGDHYFDISVRDASGAEIYNASSRDGFEDNTARIVRDAFGRYYIAFTADQPYQSVRITLHNDAAAGLDAVTTMNVYSMCRETVFDPCEQATFTSFDGTGLNVNLLEGANPAGVINPQYVIDGNNSNYSELSLGTAAIGATIYQDIYYKTKVTTTATDKVRLRMQVPTALVNADILGAYRIYLYNGDDEVYDATLQSALINGLDLLGLLNSGGRVNVEFEPGAGITYDRVRFEVGSVLGLGIGNPVRLYNVYRISDACPDPEFEQPPFEVCADVIIGDGANVDDIQNLTDGNHNSYATIRSDAGLVAGIGAYSGHVELGFNTVVPAGTSSYIRIGYEEEILNALLAGSLGGLVNDLLNGVALGDHYFNVIVKDENGNEVVTGSSRDLFDEANGQIRLVQDTKGRYYLEIRPTVAYQSVRLEDHTTALLGALSSEGHLDVYGMCHTPTTFECPAVFSTSYEGSGLTLDALNLGGAGVQNAFWAIDQNTSSASTLSLGTLNVGGSIQQHIQFGRVLAAGDPIQIKMKVGSGTLNAGILSDLEVIGYLDGVEVFTHDFNTAFIEANILDILNGSEPAVVTVNSTGDIDEIAIRLSSVVSASVAPNVSIYYVIPFCESFSGSYLQVTANNAVADGVDENEVTATVLDQDDNPMANRDVVFTVTNVDGTTYTQTVTTDGDGKAPLPITSTLAGDVSVTAEVEGMVIAVVRTGPNPDDVEDAPAVVTFIIPNNLSITKVADEPAGVTAGESTTFTATITNDGPAPIAVGKVIPLNERPSDGLAITNYEVTSGNATVLGTGNSASVTTTAAVPAGGTITLTITADVAANAPETVTNGIDVWGPDRDPDNDTPDDSDDTDPIPVDRDYGLDGNITKLATAGADAVAVAGKEFEYTVTVVNGGPSTILSGTVLFLQDELSAGQAITSIEAGSANITVGTVAADGSFTVTANEDIEETEQFTLTVTADVAGDITADVVNNTINVWSEDPAGDYSTPEGTDTTPDYPVDRDYGFEDPGAVVKVATDGATAVATAGEAFSYTVTLTNMGPSTINAGTVLYLQDLASAGQTVTGITSDNGAVGTIGTQGEFTLTVADAVAPNETIVLTVAVDVAADITADVVNNTINVWSEDPAGDYSTPEGTDTTPDYPVDRDYDFGGDNVVKAAVDGAAAVAVAGEEFAYTVTVTNGGPSTITAGTVLYLQDELSAGQSINSITAGSANVTVGSVGADGFFTVTANADIADGETFSLTVTANVDADAPATINNTINIWSNDPAGDPSNPDGSDTTPDYPVDRESVLSITKDANDDRVTAGESTSFTLTITNEGPSAIASGEVINLGERPSAGLTVTGYEVTSGNGTVTGTGNSAEVTTSAVIPVGSTITLTVTAGVDADAPATITNGIDVWGPDKDPETDTPDDGDDTPEIPVDRESNLSITKVADDARVIAGGNTSFTVTVTNDGPSAIASGEMISLGERPTAGLTITGYTVTSGNGTAAGTGNSATVTTSAVVPVGGTITLTVTADVDADAPATVANGIDVWGPDKDPETDTPDDGDDTPEIPVDRESNLSITKVADDTRVIAGGSTSFTVTVTNDGPSAIASGEVISLGERPTAGLTITGYEVTSGNGTATGTGNSATVTTSAVIPVGGTITVSVTADVDANAPATVANGIDVWGPDKDPETDTPDDGDDTPDIPVDRESNLSITKVADQSRVKAGTNTTFTVTVTNNGPSVIETGETIQLGERPSTGVTITGYEVISGAATVASTGNNATLTTTGAIAVDGTIVVRITAAVAADAPATITNGIDVWGPDKDPGTDDPDDEDDTPEIPVDPNYTLSITKEADQARVKAGTSTTFTVTITNNGPSSVASGSAIQVAERPGAGVTITGYEVTSGNATADGTGNTATVNTTAAIPAGGTITLKISADIAGDAEGTITNGIAVWSPDKDPGTDDPDDEDDTPEVPVDPNRMLSITKVADQETVIAGTSTTFTVTVTNNGPSRILTGEVVSLGERPDAGITITGYEVISGNATVSGTGNSATLTTTSALAVDGTIVVKVTADVTAAVGQTISNGIAVWGPDKDPGTDEEDDETETPEIPVVAPYTLTIEKVGDQPIVEAGTATSFTVTITNNGPLEIEAGKDIALEERPGTGVTITGYEIVSGAATIAGNGNSATITTNGVVGVSSTIVVRITADVAETATGTITNGIAVWGPGKNPGSEDPDDEDDTNPIPIDATLEIPNLFTPNGDGLNDRFVIKNLMQYNDREVLILNRWGNQVYKSPNYNNDWDGNSLSEGTYYYIIRVRNGNGEWQTFKGAIALIRVTNR